MKNILSSFIMTVLLFSCNSYYKVLTVQNPAESDVAQSINIEKKYFIIHGTNNAFLMENILFSNKNITCQLSELPQIHTVHLNRTNPKKFKYSTGQTEYDETAVLNEIHFYTDSTAVLTKGTASFAVYNITKIEIIEKDNTKTRRKRLIAWGVGGGATIVVLALLIESSLKFKL